MDKMTELPEIPTGQLAGVKTEKSYEIPTELPKKKVCNKDTLGCVRCESCDVNSFNEAIDLCTPFIHQKEQEIEQLQIHNINITNSLAEKEKQLKEYADFVFKCGEREAKLKAENEGLLKQNTALKTCYDHSIKTGCDHRNKIRDLEYELQEARKRVSVEELAKIIAEKIWEEHEGCEFKPGQYKDCPEECCYKNAAQAIHKLIGGSRV